MTHIYALDGRHLPRGAFTDAAGTRHPGAVLDLWSDLDLADIGVTRAPAPPVPLAEIKRQIKAHIDRQAEVERARYITLGGGQAMTYQAKSAEAVRFAGDHAPQADDYPLLAAEVGVTGETLQQVAQVVINMHAQWQVVGGLIERARLSAKAAVDAAPDETVARAVVPAWPSA